MSHNESHMNEEDGNCDSGCDSLARTRNDSESSKSSEDGAEQNKRQKTTNEFVQSVSASPPKFVSLEEIIAASKGIKNMALAHEIAVDKDFKLKKLNTSDNPVHKIVKETMHRAFWDIFEAQLKEDPPVYSHALVLLEEIKENLFSLLLPQHVKLREQITETLDIELIKQQAEKGVLDFQYYAHYVINLMSKLCAPARDEKICELMKMSDTVSIFKGILQTLELMLLDWANFHIGIIRPKLVQQSVEYEKKKFSDFLQVVPEGLDNTRAWLLKHYKKSSSSIQVQTSTVVAEAYLDLMDWNPKDPFPETLSMDEIRFKDLSELCLRLSVVGAVLLVTATSVPALQGIASFKDTLKDHINTIVQEAKTQKEIEVLMPSVVAQVVKDVNKALAQYGHTELDVSTSKLLDGQIVDVGRPDNHIRQLIGTRVREFLHLTITSPTAAPLRVPPGLSSLNVELTALTGRFLRLVSHNRSVFGEFYSNIISAAIAANGSIMD